MKKIVVGILAHVDAGKTTLSEALLYCSGCRRAFGRVDHGDAYLDTHALERQRGITIFSKQALLTTPQLDVTLVDTPGHVDFSAEVERSLWALDAAVLVVCAVEGVQPQTEVLFSAMQEQNIPVICYGLRADFQGNLFEGSTWLMAWADTIEEIKTVCWCGRKATFNTRISGGKVVKEGEQIMLGGDEAYVALCRKHWATGELGPEQA